MKVVTCLLPPDSAGVAGVVLDAAGAAAAVPTASVVGGAAGGKRAGELAVLRLLGAGAPALGDGGTGAAIKHVPPCCQVGQQHVNRAALA